MNIGELNMRCGVCSLIDICGEPYDEICICGEERFKNINEKSFMSLIETSKRKSIKAKINDVHKMLTQNPKKPKIKANTQRIWEFDDEIK